MEWITEIQRAIDYVEEHLPEEIDYEAVAKEACSSAFHFQRIFRILCGLTLGDYIRMRRLSLAASDLIDTSEKVIDIALKYGYDTPESFTRAFTRFHGAAPTEVRRTGHARSFSRLSVKLILTGGSMMEYRIEKLDALQVVCKRKTMEKMKDAGPATDISAFWEECTADGFVRKLAGYIPADPRLKGLVGICWSGKTEDSHFPYAIGAEYDGRELEEGLEVLDIPAHTYAVFTCKGKLPEAFTKTYSQIISEFFPQSSRYEYAHDIEMEIYPSDQLDDPDYTCEIWVVVHERN